MQSVITSRANSDRLREVAKRANQLHAEGYHCSETILRAVWPFVMPETSLSDEIIKMIMPLRGGMAATMSSHCGGLTVAVLMIGARFGRVDLQGDGKLAPSIARKYWQIFLDEFETSQCTLLRSGEPGPEAESRCGCIIVRSSVLITSLIDAIEKEQPAIEEIHSWKVDRRNEPCHEQVAPMKSSDEQ